MDKKEQFAVEIRVLFAAIDVPCSPEAIAAFWRVLRDVPLPEVKARIEAWLADAEERMRKGVKTIRPPKAWDLRPAAPPRVEDDPAFRDISVRNLLMWDEMRVHDPIRFALTWNIDLCARKVVALNPSDLAYADWNREARRWMDVARMPLEQQRRELPTFAMEADMPIEKRWARMREIQAQRALGVRADEFCIGQRFGPEKDTEDEDDAAPFHGGPDVLPREQVDRQTGEILDTFEDE